MNPPQILDNVEDINLLINRAYQIFKDDFIDNDVFFNSHLVKIANKDLDCTNCGYKCNNHFNCDSCPYKDKKDIFQHITSDRDYNLKLCREYKKLHPKNKNTRTPGIVNRDRLRRIPWIKFLIENYDKNGILHILEDDKNNKKRKKLKIYDKSLDYLVILNVTKTLSGLVSIYLASAYNNPPISYLKGFKCEKRHPVGVSTAPDTD